MASEEKVGVCSRCGDQTKLDHVDDIGTKFFRCKKCGEYTTRPTPKEDLATESAPAKAEITPPEGPEEKTCGDCSLWLKDECDYLNHARQGTITKSDPACEKFRERLVSGEYFDEHGMFIPKLLADEIMKCYHFVTMMDNEQIYVYVDGFYQPLGEILIKKECKDRLEDQYRKNRATEVIDYIKASTYTKRREESANFIPLENGILDLNGNPWELMPYSPDLMFFNKTPVKYDPKADCPNIKKFHEEITGSKEDAKILEEILGYCLYREYFIAKALMLAGGGANGKSTWLALAKRFLGIENVSGRSLQDLEEHRFAKADLHTKLANIYADLPDKALFRTGMFKMLTGRDLLSAERKFQNSFHFVNYAKLMFSANKVPEAYDDSTAFFRRWIIIIFPNEFVGEDADPQILKKLTTEEELSGLLNLALDGLKRLLENGQFSYSKTTEEIKEDYTRKSSPIAAFVMDCLETDSDAFVEKKTLYNEFAEYCRQRSLPAVTQDTFFKNMSQHVAVADFRPHVEGKRHHTFKGIRYRADGWSTRSTRSRVFYTLVEKRDEYKEPYKLVGLNDLSYIKVELPPDRMDRVDRTPKVETETETLGEKITAIYSKAKELAQDSVFSKISVADALKDQIERAEVLQLLDKLKDEGKLIEKGAEHFLLVEGGATDKPSEKVGGSSRDLDKLDNLDDSSKTPQDIEWEWGSFHVIGAYTPDIAYKKTVASLRQLQKQQTLTSKDILQIIAFYWTTESHPRVLDRLLKDEVIDNQVYVISKLRAEWTTDLTEEEIIERLVQIGGLSPAKAKDLFEDLAGIKLLWYDRNGRTLWKWSEGQ